MISLLEHMYQELGLVAHLHMNHITLRTWLVSEGGRGRERGGRGWREMGEGVEREGERVERDGGGRRCRPFTSSISLCMCVSSCAGHFS